MKPYEAAYVLEQENIDSAFWTMGAYVQSAVTVAVEHCLGGSKARSKYVEKPFYMMSKESIISSEEDEIRNAKLLFASLDIQKANWELDKKHKEG